MSWYSTWRNLAQRQIYVLEYIDSSIILVEDGSRLIHNGDWLLSTLVLTLLRNIGVWFQSAFSFSWKVKVFRFTRFKHVSHRYFSFYNPCWKSYPWPSIEWSEVRFLRSTVIKCLLLALFVRPFRRGISPKSELLVLIVILPRWRKKNLKTFKIYNKWRFEQRLTLKLANNLRLPADRTLR